MIFFDIGQEKFDLLTCIGIFLYIAAQITLIYGIKENMNQEIKLFAHEIDD